MAHTSPNTASIMRMCGRDTPAKFATHHFMVIRFRVPTDLSGTLSAAAMEREQTLVYNLLTQLAGALEDQGFTDLGSMLDSVRKIGNVPDVMHRWHFSDWV